MLEPPLIRSRASIQTLESCFAGTKLSLDFASLLGPIFFTWLVQQLLPFMLVTLVTEKERGCAPYPTRVFSCPFCCVSTHNGVATESCHPVHLCIATGRQA